MSSTSLIRPSRWRPPRRTWEILSFCFGVGSLSSRSWPKPRMALSGVRSSWLMRERNSFLAALARWASSRAASSANSAALRSLISRCTLTQCVHQPRSLATGTMFSSTQNSRAVLAVVDQFHAHGLPRFERLADFPPGLRDRFSAPGTCAWRLANHFLHRVPGHPREGAVGVANARPRQVNRLRLGDEDRVVGVVDGTLQHSQPVLGAPTLGDV